MVKTKLPITEIELSKQLRYFLLREDLTLPQQSLNLRNPVSFHRSKFFLLQATVPSREILIQGLWLYFSCDRTPLRSSSTWVGLRRLVGCTFTSTRKAWRYHPFLRVSTEVQSISLGLYWAQDLLQRRNLYERLSNLNTPILRYSHLPTKGMGFYSRNSYY